MISLPRAMKHVVVTKEGDPLCRAGRARLIWAANTAEATAALGIPCLLAGGANAFTYPVESIAGTFAAYRALEALYGVSGQFDLALLHPDPGEEAWSVDGDFRRHVLPHAAFVQTRDPRIVLACVRRRIPYIFEHHAEDYQDSFAPWDELRLASPLCLAVVAITEAVKAQLLARRVPAAKIIVLDSGVNARAALRRPEAASRWRHNLLTPPYHRLAVYTGGMQAERGIGDLMNAAAALPDTLFILAGGHDVELADWRNQMVRHGLGNVRLIGYQNHEVVCELQQAADVLIFSRAVGKRGEITSPLKVFEYLLSGTPVVAAKIPATQRLAGQELASHLYDPTIQGDLPRALAASFKAFPYRMEGYGQNIRAGEPFIWQERQRRLMDFIGDFPIKVTF
ncbi:glycosyltransferase [Roseomonas aerophila]|uniref:Glycosyltransferase n=1 Tax=Teichococcus aerophilus TaxID=1224513 RepID=A0ABR7RRM6_9PROT|nr:glycosyltransferase [Pseudoroseomonas aerophila]MBC9209270.1 glycosyltransferase [Pseudoroseomonas aerophila]